MAIKVTTNITFALKILICECYASVLYYADFVKVCLHRLPVFFYVNMHGYGIPKRKLINAPEK